MIHISVAVTLITSRSDWASAAPCMGSVPLPISSMSTSDPAFAPSSTAFATCTKAVRPKGFGRRKTGVVTKAGARRPRIHTSKIKEHVDTMLCGAIRCHHMPCDATRRDETRRDSRRDANTVRCDALESNGRNPARPNAHQYADL